MNVQPWALFWTFNAAVFLGSGNWLSSYIGLLGQPQGLAISLWWVTTTLTGIPISLFNLVNDTKRNKLIQQRGGKDFPTPELKWRAIIYSLLSSLSACCGMFCLTRAFANDHQNIGPISAIIATDVLVATILCHFALKERLSSKQWTVALLITIGIVVMFLGGDQEKTPTETESTQEPVAESTLTPTTTSSMTTTEVLEAVMKGEPVAPAEGNFVAAATWAIGACFGFVGSNMFCKIGFVHCDIHPMTQYFLQLTLQGGVGLIALIYSVSNEDISGAIESVKEEDTYLLVRRWILNFFQGICTTLGLLCLTYSMTYRCTGVVLSLLGGGVVMTCLLLNFTVATMPSTEKMIGMVIVFIGVVTLPLLPMQEQIQTDDEDEEKKPYL